MIANIPRMQRPPIERETLFEAETDEHPLTVLKKQEAEKQAAHLAKIRSCCAHLRESNPGAWDELQKEFQAFYSSVMARTRTSPYSYMRSNVDPGWWAICETFNRAQILILESVCATLSMKLSNQIIPVRKKSLKKFLFDSIAPLWHLFR